MAVVGSATLDTSSLISKPGMAIKAVPRGNGMIEGYLIAWGSPQDADLEGQWFSQNTDLRLDYFRDHPLLYHHGMDPVVGLDPIGRIKSLDTDNVGLYIRAHIDTHSDFGRAAYDLIRGVEPDAASLPDEVMQWAAGQWNLALRYAAELPRRGFKSRPALFGWSSGSIDHLVKIAPDGHILQWPLFEGSVTPTPAQPKKTTIRALKSLHGSSHAFFMSLGGLSDIGADSESGKTTTVKSDAKGEKTMASKWARMKVRSILKSEGIKVSAAKEEQIAEELEIAQMSGELDDDAMMSDFEDDAVMSDFEDDAMLADDEFAMMSDGLDDDAMMSDFEDDAMMSDFEDDAMLADDEFATMSDFEDDAMMSDFEDDAMLADDLEDDAIASWGMSRRSYRRPRAKSASPDYVRSLERRLERLERQPASGERRIGTKAFKGMRITDEADRPGRYEKAFKAYMRFGDSKLDQQDAYVLRRGEQRWTGADSIDPAIKALNISNAGSFGFAVPEDWVNDLNRHIMVDAVTAADCNQRTTTSDTIRQPNLVPTDARRAFPGTVYYPGETPASQSAHQITDMGLSELQLPIHVVLVSTYASLSSLEDVAFDLQALINEQFAESIAVEMEDKVINGNGVGKMLGILNTTTVTGSASTGVSSVSGYVASGKAAGFANGDPILALVKHLPPAYRRNAKWYMSSDTALSIEQLKDGNGRYLWGDEQGLNSGSVEMLRGRPVVYNEWMPSIAANQFPIIFGDLSKGYMIGKRVEFSIRRFDDSSTAVLDQALFIGRARFGGQVWQPAALKVLKVAAS